MNYFIDPIKRYIDFNGRAGRKEYWMFFLFYMVFYIGFAVVDAALDIQILTAIYTLALLLPSFSIAARRLHDTGRSGWWQLLYLIPIIGFIVLIVFLVQDSHEENAYGSKPKLEQSS